MMNDHLIIVCLLSIQYPFSDTMIIDILLALISQDEVLAELHKNFDRLADRRASEIAVWRNTRDAINTLYRFVNK